MKQFIFKAMSFRDLLSACMHAVGKIFVEKLQNQIKITAVIKESNAISKYHHCWVNWLHSLKLLDKTITLYSLKMIKRSQFSAITHAVIPTTSSRLSLSTFQKRFCVGRCFLGESVLRELSANTWNGNKGWNIVWFETIKSPINKSIQ